MILVYWCICGSENDKSHFRGCHETKDTIREKLIVQESSSVFVKSVSVERNHSLRSSLEAEILRTQLCFEYPFWVCKCVPATNYVRLEMHSWTKKIAYPELHTPFPPSIFHTSYNGSSAPPPAPTHPCNPLRHNKQLPLPPPPSLLPLPLPPPQPPPLPTPSLSPSHRRRRLRRHIFFPVFC